MFFKEFNLEIGNILIGDKGKSKVPDLWYGKDTNRIIDIILDVNLSVQPDKG